MTDWLLVPILLRLTISWQLKCEFKVTIGTLDFYLGMEINQSNDDGSISIKQSSYTRKILKRFGMDEANAVSTPIEISKDCKAGENSKNCFPYREAVGSLMYLAVVTRPDIAYAVSVASENLENPNSSDWQNVKRIFRYLTGTSNHGLVYKTEHGQLVGYSDADFRGDQKLRRSRSGVVCKYAGAAICWLSQKQKCVTLSTTEAEYVAGSEGAKELIWASRLISGLIGDKIIPVLYMDNASAIKLTKNPEFHKRTKHIDIKFHFIREKLTEGLFDVKHVAGNNQIADIMTKPLAKPRFEILRSMLGLLEIV